MNIRTPRTGGWLPGLLVVLLAFSVGAEEKYIKYDFSHPEKVFKATLNETVAGENIDPAALYRLLRSGQVVIVNEHPNHPDVPWLTTSGVLVHAPAEVVFEMVTNFNEYSEFVPQVDSSYYRPINSEIVQVFYELGIQVLFIKVKVPYSVYHWNQPPYRTDWVMAGGDFLVNVGAYEVLPVPGRPEDSMLFYTSYALPRNRVVVQLFNKIPNLDLMINLSTGTLVVKAMKNRAEEIFQKNDKSRSRPEGRLNFLDLLDQDADTIAELASRGALIVLEDTTPRFYSGVAVLNLSQNEAYQCVSDPSSLDQASEQVETELLEKQGNTARVRYHMVFNLVVDFDTEYVLDYRYHPPRHITWVQEPSRDISGVAGSWELVPLGEDKTLAVYRNTSDLYSMGIMMRQLLKIEPAFEIAIQASQTQLTISDIKKFCESKGR